MTHTNRPDAGHALLTDDEALTLAAEFDAAVANAPRTWMPTSADLRITQDDLDAAHDALVEIPRCPDCDGVLSDDDMRSIHGHANGCDVDETVFHCRACDAQGVFG